MAEKRERVRIKWRPQKHLIQKKSSTLDDVDHHSPSGDRNRTFNATLFSSKNSILNI